MIDVDKLKQHVYDVIGALHAVHKELGPGVNEYCYQEALAIELSENNIPFEREKAFHPTYRGHAMNAEFRLDFLCKGDVTLRKSCRHKVLAIERGRVSPRALGKLSLQLFKLLSQPRGICYN